MEEYLTISADLQHLGQQTITSPSKSSTEHINNHSTSPPQTDVYYCNPIGGSSDSSTQNLMMDMRNIDILGTLQTVKKILHPTDMSSTAYYAIHKMNNTLLVDEISIANLDAYLSEAKNSTCSSNTHNEDTKVQFTSEATSSQIPSDQMISAIMPALPISFQQLPTVITPITASTTTIAEGDKENMQQLISTKHIHMGSLYLPPPYYYMPSTPLPSKQVHLWQLNELRLALGSDLVLCAADNHPSMTIKTLDTTKELEYQTCLDFYLDNIMANIPELALCLHSKGFIRGLHLTTTERIPYLKAALLEQPYQNTSTNTSTNNTPNNQEGTPMFEPSVVEANALTILRFLKENCKKDSTTYILRRNHSEDALQIYDLTTMSTTQQKRWKWLLAMVSHRFALRLGHYIHIGSKLMKHQIRERQCLLFASSHQLLNDIKDLGGDGHQTIQASLLEQMADINLAKIDEYSSNSSNGNSTSSTEAVVGGDKRARTSSELDEIFDEDFNLDSELKSALSYIVEALHTLADMITQEYTNKHQTEVNNTVNNIAPAATVSGVVNEQDEQQQQDSIEVLGSLATQYAGLLHKLVNVTSLIIQEALKSAYIKEGLHYLSKLNGPILIWNRLRQHIFLPNLVGDESKSNLWGADKTCVLLLPILWSSFGELTREVCRQTAGVSAHNCLDILMSTVQTLTHFTLSTHAPPPSSTISLLNSSITTNTQNTNETNDAGNIMIQRKAYIDYLWSILSCTVAIDTISSDPTLQALDWLFHSISPAVLFHISLSTDIFDNNNIDNNASKQNKGTTATTTVSELALNDDLYALLVLIYCYTCAALVEYPYPTSSSMSVQKQSHSISSSTTGISSVNYSSVVSKNNSKKLDHKKSNKAYNSNNINKNNKSGTLSNTSLKSITPVNQLPTQSIELSAFSTSSNAINKNLSYNNSIRVNSIAYTSCLRRLGASCSQFGQQLFSLASESANNNNTTDNTSANYNSIAMSENIPKVHCYLAFTNKCFHISLQLFDKIGDQANSIMLICNFASVLRFQADWINRNNTYYISCLTKRYKSKKKNSVKKKKKKQQQSEDDKEDSAAAEENGVVIEDLPLTTQESLRYLELALSYCMKNDSFVDISSNQKQQPLGEDATTATAVPTNIVSKNITLQAETAQTYLHIGLILKSYVMNQQTSSEILLKYIQYYEQQILDSFQNALNIYRELNNLKQEAAVRYQLGSFYSTYWNVSINKSNVHVEKALEYYGNAYQYYYRYDIGPILIHILTNMTDLYFSSFLVEEQIFRQFCEKSKSFQLSNEIVQNLLGGALISLLDCRFAFTEVVIQRYFTQMSELVIQVASRLSKVLLKLFNVQYLMNTSREKEMATLKRIYMDVLELLVDEKTGVVAKDVSKKKKKDQSTNLSTTSSTTSSTMPAGGMMVCWPASRLYEILDAMQKLDLGFKL